jgi:hypothetical protein
MVNMTIKDNGPLVTETRDIINGFPPGFYEETEQFIDAHPYQFYAILLGRDSDKALKDYFEKNWTNLHYMSGDECLLLSVYTPQRVDETIKMYWENKLGDSFEKIFNKSAEVAWTYSYARQLGVSFNKLPCLFIGTDLKKNSGIVVNIPPLGEKDLLSLFELFFQKTREASGLDSEARLKAIVDSIENFYMAKVAGLYVKNNWWEYVNPKENLKKVIEILVAAGITALKVAL